MIKAEINTNDLKAVLRSMPPVLKAEMADGLDHVSRKFLKEFRQRRLSGRPGLIGRPHGIFSRFHRNPIDKGKEGAGMLIFSESKIAELHEKGGAVTAGSGEKIAAPLSARKELFTSQGALRQRYRTRTGRRSLRPIHFGQETFLARINRKTREVLPFFVLKRSVYLKPRLEFYKTWDSMRGTIFEILAKRLIRAVKKEWSEGEVRFRI